MNLSVIVTVYNREHVIARCLDSLLKQGLSSNEYEIIVIDDGSTDQSLQIIQQYSQKYPQIKVYTKQNQGVASARNDGLTFATGKYITYLDSDDTIKSNFYSSALNIIEEKGCDIFVFDAVKKDQEKEERFQMVNAEEGHLSASQFILACPAPWNKIIKKDLFINASISFPKGLIYEDYATIPLLALATKNIYYQPIQAVQYYVNNQSITRQNEYRSYWMDLLPASKCLERLHPTYYEEVEFMVYQHLLLEMGKQLNQYEKYNEILEIINYMKMKYPRWMKNKYVRKQKVKDRWIAKLLYYNKGAFINRIIRLKKKVN